MTNDQRIEQLLKVDPEIDLLPGEETTLKVSTLMDMKLYWIRFPVALYDALVIKEVLLGNEILMTSATAARISATRFDRRLLPLQSLKLHVKNVSINVVHVSGGFFGTIHFDDDARPYGPPC